MHLHAQLFDHALQAVLFDDALCLLRRFLRLLIQTLAQVFHLFQQLAIHSLGLSLLRIPLRFFLFQLRIFRLALLHDFLLTHGSCLLVQVKGPALYSYTLPISQTSADSILSPIKQLLASFPEPSADRASKCRDVYSPCLVPKDAMTSMSSCTPDPI